MRFYISVDYMDSIFLYTLGSVFLVSIMSFVGVFTLAMKTKHLEKILLFLVSFSAGALFGDTFIHLLPEAVNEFGFGLEVSLYLLLGIILFFIMEKFICWRHCHIPTSTHHPHPIATMNLIGDFVHNFIDGLVIAASYMASIPLGIATTIAVLLHEIPQEIGDFGILIHGGFSKKKAIMFNFLSALAAVLGALIALYIGITSEHMLSVLIPFAAGGFIYIAGSDLIPELHKETNPKKSIIQLLAMLLGIGVMMALVLVG